MIAAYLAYGRSRRNARATGDETGQRKAERVVSLGPAVTELIYAVGRGNIMVGRTRYCDHPEEALSVPIVSDYLSPDVERVLSVKPDMVFVSPGPGNRDAVEKLWSLGVRVDVLPLYTLDEIKKAALRLGELLDAKTEAGKLVENIERELEELKRKAAGNERVRVLFVVSHDPLVLAAPGSLPGELLEIAGGINAAPATAGKTYVSVEREKLSSLRPKVVIDASAMGDSGNTLKEEELRRFYRSVPGWPGDVRVVIARDDAIYLPGANVVHGARLIYEFLHGAAAAGAETE